MVPAPPVLEVYYASTCAPCRLELPVIAEAVREGLAVTVVLLTEETRALRELAEASPDLAAHARPVPSPDPRTTLRAAGDPDGILPFSRIRAADGRTCTTWRGTLTLDRVRAMLARCTAGK